MPATNRNAPIGGPISWFMSRYPPWSRAFASPIDARGTSRGSRLVEARSANVSAVPSRSSPSRTIGTLIDPVAMVVASTASTPARTRLTRMMIRRRSARSTTTPANVPNTSEGRNSQKNASETTNGSRVWLATRRGPAASTIPSPMLVNVEADHSQRKPAPRRAGRTLPTTASRALGMGGSAYRSDPLDK